jgi:hypothetical protein
MKIHSLAALVLATLLVPSVAQSNPKPPPPRDPPQKTETVTVFRAKCLRQLSVIWSCGDNITIYFDPGDQHALVPAKDLVCKADQLSKVPDKGSQAWRVDGCTYHGRSGHIFSCPSTPEGPGATISLTNKAFSEALNSCSEELQVLVK